MINNFLDEEEIQYQPYNKVYCHVSGHCIYLGDASAANDHEFIKEKQIGLVVTVAADMNHLKYADNVKHLIYSLLDCKSENMSKHFKNFYELVQEEIVRTNILVHCFAGISRSATMVISYMMKKNNFTFKQAIAQVRRYRPKVLPNLGFERQLKQYERLLKTEEMSMTRRMISKTSQSRKHQAKKNAEIGLPQIYALGKTLARSKNINIQITPKPQPSSQMQSRKIRMGYFEEQKLPAEEESFLKNLEVFSNKLPIKTFRKQSISISRKKRINLYESEGKEVATLVRLPPHKLAIKQIKFGTQKIIKSIALKDLRFN